MKRQHAWTPTDQSPPANPDWQRSAPVQSKDGKSVWVDAMVVAEVDAHCRAFGIKPVGAP